MSSLVSSLQFRECVTVEWMYKLKSYLHLQCSEETISLLSPGDTPPRLTCLNKLPLNSQKISDAIGFAYHPIFNFEFVNISSRKA